MGDTAAPIRIDEMTLADGPAVLEIYIQGIATGNATLETTAPDWARWHASHRRDCRLVARLERSGRRLDRAGSLLHAGGLCRRCVGERLRRRGGPRSRRRAGAPRGARPRLGGGRRTGRSSPGCLPRTAPASPSMSVPAFAGSASRSGSAAIRRAAGATSSSSNAAATGSASSGRLNVPATTSRHSG